MKRFCFFLLCGFLLAVLVPRDSVSLAKGASDKMIMTGPGISGQVEITDPDILGNLTWASFGFVHGGVPAPKVAGPYYELLGYVKTQNGTLQPWDHVRYFPQSNMIFYVGQEPDNNYSEFDGKWFYPTLEGERALRRLIAQYARTPQIYSMNALRAREIATLVAVVDFYNTGSQAALDLLTEGIVWVDCDYNIERAVELKGKTRVAEWIKYRYTDDDRLHLDSIQINDDGKGADQTISAAFVLRTSKTLKANGKPNGLTPLVAAQVTFTADGQQIERFVNAPLGGPADSCRIFRL
jgi:hypothetical protein